MAVRGFGGVSESEFSELEFDSSSDESVGLGTALICLAFGLESSSLSWESSLGAAFCALEGFFELAVELSLASSSLLSSSPFLSDSAGLD